MEIKEKKQGDVLTIYISGRLDNINSQELVELVTKAVDSGEHNLLFNFENLTYLNSTGLQVLLDLENKIKAKGGKLAICSVKMIVKRVIEIVDFSKMVLIYDNEEEALKHFL